MTSTAALSSSQTTQAIRLSKMLGTATFRLHLSMGLAWWLKLIIITNFSGILLSKKVAF